MWRHGAAAAAAAGAAGAAAVRQVAGSGAEPQPIKSCPLLLLLQLLVRVVQAHCLPVSLQVSTTKPPPSSWTAAESSWSCGESVHFTLSCCVALPTRVNNSFTTAVPSLQTHTHTSNCFRKKGVTLGVTNRFYSVITLLAESGV